MIVAPAVDVRGGRCVQLVGGDPEQEAVSLTDPVAAARRWRELGFNTLHLVDLDAALGAGDNQEVLTRVLRDVPGDAQVGGGVRTEADVAAWLDAGADRVVVGTRAVDDPEWATELASRYPGHVVIAADVREDRVLRRGWQETSGWTLADFMNRLAAAPIAGFLVTDVGREGRLVGLDGVWLARVVERSPHPVWASGGVGTTNDLTIAKQHGAHGVVVGMALYTGAIEPEDALDLMNRSNA